MHRVSGGVIISGVYYSRWDSGMYCVQLTWFKPYDWHWIIENLRNLLSQHTTVEERITYTPYVTTQLIGDVLIMVSNNNNF